MNPATVTTADTHALRPWLWGLPLAAALWVAIYWHLSGSSPPPMKVGLLCLGGRAKAAKL